MAYSAVNQACPAAGQGWAEKFRICPANGMVFEEYEWKALYAFVHKTTEPPKQEPSLQEAIRMIAKLGGFLGRKSDGQPGSMTLWRGLHRLTDIAEAWRVFRPWPTPRPRKTYG